MALEIRSIQSLGNADADMCPYSCVSALLCVAMIWPPGKACCKAQVTERTEKSTQGKLATHFEV